MHRSTPLLIGAAVVLAVIGLVVPTASAASGTANASVTAVSLGAGTTSTYTFTLAPTSSQISSFNLSVPSGWTISPPANGSGLTWTATTLQGRGLSISASSPFSVSFTAQAPCAATGASLNTTWSVAAKTGGNFTGSSFTVNQPSTPLTGGCSAAFVTGRGPADAALNGGTKSEAITSVPYTPTGDPMQVAVRDADGNLRGGISVTLDASGGGGSEAAGDKSATTGSDPNDASTFGIATFSGSVTLANIGQGYVFTPTGAFDGTASGEFGIYQEGDQCASSCTVHGKSGDNTIKSTVVSNGNGNLGVLVADVGLSCAGSIPAGYDYRPLSAHITVWKYTGTGTQTVSILIDKTVIKAFLNRGSAHIDFCLDSEGKPFKDKFGNWHWTNLDTNEDAPDTPGLLPDCNQTADGRNCIVSENALNGGSRLVTVTVEDGKGRI
jgi:hypothetical protein